MYLLPFWIAKLPDRVFLVFFFFSFYFQHFKYINISWHSWSAKFLRKSSLLIFWAFLNICCCCCQVISVVSDSVRPYRWQPTRLPRPWDSPGKYNGVGCHFLLQSMKVKSESEVTQSCPTLRDSMDCSLPGSSIHGIFQARVLEWVSIALIYN